MITLILKYDYGHDGHAILDKKDVSCMIDGAVKKVVAATIDPIAEDKNQWMYQVKFANILGLKGHRTNALMHTVYIQDRDGVHRILATVIDDLRAVAVMYKNDVYIGRFDFQEQSVFEVHQIIHRAETYTPLPMDTFGCAPTDHELYRDFILATQKIIYSKKVKLPGQTMYQHEMACDVIEAFSDTGLSDVKFEMALRPFIPDEYDIIIRREKKNNRISEVLFSPVK